jgi:hypothetical protein
VTESIPASAQTSTGEWRNPKRGESIVSAVSVGIVFILFASVYIIALPASLWDSVVTFFTDLSMRQVPGTGIYLPAPMNPAEHTVLYTAAYQFCLGLIFLQVVVLLIRLFWNSPVRKIAETVGDIVFWSGSALLVTTFLNANTTINTWFAYWACILIVIGISLVVRAIVLLVKR